MCACVVGLAVLHVTCPSVVQVRWTSSLGVPEIAREIVGGLPVNPTMLDREHLLGLLQVGLGYHRTAQINVV